MDVIVIFNGLGNQMSQYAFYISKKSVSRNTHFIRFCKDHNGYELNKLFGIKSNSIIKEIALYFLFRLLLTTRGGKPWQNVKKFLASFGVGIVYENFDYSFRDSNQGLNKGIKFYFGGWHTEKYFGQYKSRLIHDLKFMPPSDQVSKEYINLIVNTNSVSIHVRRGDYLSPENQLLLGGVCTLDYYQRAVEYIYAQISDPQFIIFSNDIPWVKQNLNLSKATYISENTSDNSWKDMYLMSICKHNIVANSSFSWWGAWLNINPNSIKICPDRFLSSDKTTDVYPDSWLKISTIVHKPIAQRVI